MRSMLIAPLIVFLVLLLAFVQARSATVEVVRTLGGEDDDLFLHNPMAVTPAADGTWYLLNAGECQVLHLTADWRVMSKRSFCAVFPRLFLSGKTVRTSFSVLTLFRGGPHAPTPTHN